MRNVKMGQRGICPVKSRGEEKGKELLKLLYMVVMKSRAFFTIKQSSS